jgi:hypothetical protein
VGETHPTVLTVSAPKEVYNAEEVSDQLLTKVLQISDVEGACQGLLGLEPY